MATQIHEYIRANRDRYTRQAINEQLLAAGYDQAAIDAAWAMLDAPDPDATIGQRFWGRFWLYLLGINVAVLLIVGLLSGMFGALSSSLVLLIILAVALTIGALIAWGVVAATQPTQLGRRTAIAIGSIIPLLFAFLIGGSCYALVGAIGPPPPPPVRGTVTLRIDPPLELEVSGPALCQLPAAGESFYNVYTESDLPSAEGPIAVFINAFSEVPGGEPVPTLGITIEQPNGFLDYQPAQGGSAGITVQPGSSAASGSLDFENFLPVEAFDEQGNPIDRFDADPISGTVTWSCES
jgi:hypothetical protein